jgi:nitroreductase
LPDREDACFDAAVRRCILSRRSIRGFEPDPVPKSLVQGNIELAVPAPSSLNTQPWSFTVVAGEPLGRIRAGNTERNLAGVPCSREFRGHGENAVAHHEGQIAIADDPVIMICVAAGWPDETFPANAVVSQRKSVDDAVVLIGFRAA